MKLARILLALALITLLVSSPRARCYAGDSITVEGLLGHHLDAIGSADARSAAKTRVIQGAAAYRIVVGGSGRADGKTGLVSEGRKFRFMMKFTGVGYLGENLVFDGNGIGVSFANTNQSRSAFASFVATQDAILREGLFGGVLTTGWALLDVADRKPKMTLEGLKKIDGHQAYQVRYSPQKRSDAQILLYFDQETFRHIKTVYSTSVANNVGATITESSKLLPERTTLEERFSDFKTVDGLTLPNHWNLQFTRELPNGSTTVSEWDLKEDQITNNVGLDPRNFEVK
jgi:hypothetical protein